MNTTSYVRSSNYKKDPYTKISNSIAKLPAPEAGIMFQILSNSDDWVVNKEVVKKRSGLGPNRFKNAWNHLQELGYIVLKKQPMINGKFSYHYIIYENPELQNPPDNIDNPYTENRTSENHTTVTGGTNNYQVIKKDQETICSSGSDGLSTKVEVRPGNTNAGPNILGHGNNTNEELQIVPHPSLCFGEVRDDDRSQIEALSDTVSTNDKKHEVLSSEYYIPGSGKISIEDKYLIEGLPEEPTEMLKAIIDDEYKEKVPTWESILFQNSYIRAFFERTEKMVKPTIFLTEVVNEYFKRVKKHY